jgi:agmatine deiminase
MPEEVRVGGVIIPASHLNFLIMNGAVLVPVFGGKSDEKALLAFDKHFPERTIIPVECRNLGYGLGGIHCITMQVAAAL